MMICAYILQLLMAYLIRRDNHYLNSLNRIGSDSCTAFHVRTVCQLWHTSASQESRAVQCAIDTVRKKRGEFWKCLAASCFPHSSQHNVHAIGLRHPASFPKSSRLAAVYPVWGSLALVV